MKTMAYYNNKTNSNYKGKNPKKKSSKVKPMRCPYCGAPVKMVPESEMNFRFHAKGPNKRDFYWVCTNYPECDAYIPADNTTKRPTGTLANAELRHMRMMIHYWQVILTMEGIMSRASFVRTMASILNIRNFNMVHVGEFTKMDAESVLEYFKMRYQNDKRVHEAVDKRPNSMLWKEMHGLNTEKNHNVVYDAETLEAVGMSDWNTPEVEADRAQLRAQTKVETRMFHENVGTFKEHDGT